MTTFLLDVNVLIALIDPAHVQHEHAHKWFAGAGKRSFATCPITENGLLRIVGHPKYPNSPGPPSDVARLLSAFRALPGHRFWPDKISIADESLVQTAQLSTHSRVTDSYLLALARANSGRLASMDARLAVDAVAGGADALELIVDWFRERLRRHGPGESRHGRQHWLLQYCSKFGG
ncbi:MAG: VapC toxin family PIN domain ribonuclease [Aquincola sp.]|nr:VapC toxin family PIN domain ribonuclease [Aquincola sp.]